jgi:excisionase family DNA binding protein
MENDQVATSPWMDVRAASEYLGVGVKTLYSAVSRGECQAAVVGLRRLRFRKEMLDAYAERRFTPKLRAVR